MRLGVFQASFAVIVTLVLFAMVMGRGEALSFGSFITFNAAFAQFFMAVLAMTGAWASALEIIPLFERIKPIVEALPEVGKIGLMPDKLSGLIKMNQISFRYQKNTPFIFQNLSLDIASGEFVALVGLSGAGKSTIFRLLLGFEKPESGNILYDNMELSTLNVAGLRRQLGVVLQNTSLMPGTILENIIGISDLTEEEAWAAVKQVALDEDIAEMPMRMQTIIIESGRTLSMGQRQRLMIARALVRKPQILLLDEASSAIDNATQALIYENLAKLEITRVIAAHRLSTIRHADRILVLNKGNIEQSGSYDSLIQEEGLFSQLVCRQTL